MFTVSYFIDFFEPIPEEKWCIYQLADGYGRRCALGHCLALGAKYGTYEALAHLFKVNLMGDKDIKPSHLVANINDGKDHKYQQSTSKQRILAALYDIKAKQAVEQVQDIVNTKKVEQLSEISLISN